MNYEHIVFDIDNTLLSTEYAMLRSLHKALRERAGKNLCMEELKSVMGIPGSDGLKKLGVLDVEATLACWEDYLRDYHYTEYIYEGVRELLDRLVNAGYRLGVVISKSKKQYEDDFVPFGLSGYFPIVICADDVKKHKPDAEPLEEYIRRSGTSADKVLYVGDSIFDMQCAAAAGVDGGLALWGSRSDGHIRASYYFTQPYDVWNQLARAAEPYEGKEWISWAMELQFMAQAGLTYTKDKFDKERFQRLRELSAEMMSKNTGKPLDYVEEVFCSETGFQTPKIDTRAAVFQDDKILLVKEWNGTWSLPGGWVDVMESVGSNTVKEVKEEAGLDVALERLIALQDRNRHNIPVYAYGICKVFMLCRVIGGAFQENIETVESRYFALEDLPRLALEKNTPEQVRMCFEAYHNERWNPIVD